jgi:hypothetical protein
MNSPILFLQLVADRKLAPGALALTFSRHDDAVLPIVVQSDFVTLAAEFPCLLRSAEAQRFSPALQTALQTAGCRLLPDEAVQRADSSPPEHLPANAHWLAGDWYLAPPPKQTGSQAASRARALKLAQLVATDADTREIEDIFRQDPALSYHLLRLVNSPGLGIGRQVASFSQAILILGRQQLRRWLNLMLFAARKEDPRAPMLLARAAVRARSSELLAKASGLDKAGQEQAFMAGMFSLLGVLFGQPLAEVLQPLRVSETLSAAVLDHAGAVGRLLQTVEAAERAEAEPLEELLAALQVAPAELNLLSLEAHRWMLGVVRDQQGGALA